MAGDRRKPKNREHWYSGKGATIEAGDGAVAKCVPKLKTGLRANTILVGGPGVIMAQAARTESLRPRSDFRFLAQNAVTAPRIRGSRFGNNRRLSAMIKASKD